MSPGLKMSSSCLVSDRSAPVRSAESQNIRAPRIHGVPIEVGTRNKVVVTQSSLPHPSLPEPFGSLE